MSPAPAGGRVLVTGAAGMLGSELLLTAPAGFEAIGTDLRAAPVGFPPVPRPGVDLAEPAAVAALLDDLAPLAGVLHAAAYTAVDRAEEQPELAERVNAEAARVLAAACRERGVALVAVSTDFVFDGTAREPYREDAPPNPTSVYGRTKLAGERAVLSEHPRGARVVRTQWLYGPRGTHFPGTILRLAGERDRLQVVADQTGCPTSSLELAPALWDVLRRAPPGVYHAACEGRATWYDLALETLRLAGRAGFPVAPCTTAEFPRPARRPAFSALDCSKLAALRGKRLAPWREALAAWFASAPPPPTRNP